MSTVDNETKLPPPGDCQRQRLAEHAGENPSAPIGPSARASDTPCGPFASQDDLPVVFASDEGFVLQLEVAARSLIRSCPACRVALHVLDCGISDETWTRLRDRLTGCARESRTVLSVRRHAIDLKAFRTFRRWNSSLATYARLMIPEFLKDVRHCLYSDCDILFFANPREMIDQLVASGKAIAGHRNPAGLDGSVTDFIWLDKVGEPYDATAYFCAGLVAMDLEQFRRHSLTEKIMAFLARHPDSVSADQSAINSCCLGHAALTTGNWGLFPHECYGVTDEIKAIHFSGGSPWKRASWYECALFRRVDRLWHDFCKRETGVDLARRTRSRRTVLAGRLAELATRALLFLNVIPASKRPYMTLMRKVLREHSAVDRLRGR